MPQLPRTTLAGMERSHRRRLVASTVARMALSCVFLLVLYGWLPDASQRGGNALVKLIVGLILFAGVLWWQIRRVLRAQHPELQALEALVIAIQLAVIVFAYVYVSMSHATAANFSEHLDKMGSLYFTVTTLGTVGFGDIVAKTDTARAIVTFQILLDLGLIVGIVRTLGFAARVGVRRQQDDAVS